MEDRDIKEIVASMMHLISSGKVSGQFAKDLEKLCCFVFVHLPEDNIYSLPQGCGIGLTPLKDAMKLEAFEELDKALKEQQEKMIKWWNKKHPGLRKE